MQSIIPMVTAQYGKHCSTRMSCSDDWPVVLSLPLI